jgi:hypothetical protein
MPAAPRRAKREASTRADIFSRASLGSIVARSGMGELDRTGVLMSTSHPCHLMSHGAVLAISLARISMFRRVFLRSPEWPSRTDNQRADKTSAMHVLFVNTKAGVSADRSRPDFSAQSEVRSFHLAPAD